MEQVSDLERTIQSSNKDIDRVGAAYALGSLAGTDVVPGSRPGNDIVSSQHRQHDALKALDRLLDGQHNARRAAMYGLAAAGMSAVDLLIKRISRPDDYPLSVVVAAVFALGEACTQPTTEVVAELGNLLVHWRRSMDNYCADVASAAADQREVSMTERAYLTSGGANSMNPMDGYATALQRGTSTVSTLTFAWHPAYPTSWLLCVLRWCSRESALLDALGIDSSVCLRQVVLALGMLAERVVANCDTALGVHICKLLLPVTCAPEPADSLPPGFVRPAQGAYWVSEGAALALLRLCSDASTVDGNCVAPTMPSQHSDARFAPGFCLLAMRRAEAGGGGVVGQAVLPMLHATLPRWQQLYALASANVPEPWLAGKLGGGVEWL